MARQAAQIELSSFVGGFITEASPLTFPQNASLDEENFVLLRDASRRRRLGMDFEEGSTTVFTDVTLPSTGEAAIQTFSWENVGGVADKMLIVVQLGNQIDIFDSSYSPLHLGKIYSEKFSDLPSTTRFSFSVVDSLLVMANGSQTISSYEYNGGSLIKNLYRLKIRDFFGLSDKIGGVDYMVGSGIAKRPGSLTNAHMYNLRNQTWAPRVYCNLSGAKGDDMIHSFFLKRGEYPSNADITTYAIYPDTAAGKTVDWFWPTNVLGYTVGNAHAPQGSFIIDALNRGSSRQAAYEEVRNLYPLTGNLPEDRTPVGASVLCSYAGRMFYAGFGSDVVDGDEYSPRMGSYVLFSTLVNSSPDLAKCYQDGDPTSKEAPDLLDTDGGFIRVDGMNTVIGMYNLGSALAIVASNGVWLVQGGSDYGFKATNYVVTKITDFGAISAGSIVSVDNTLVYWSQDGIYNIAQNQYGDYVATNISRDTIQRFYSAIDYKYKVAVFGNYDKYSKKIEWIYGGSGTSDTMTLGLDLSFNTFFKYRFKKPTGLTIPQVVASFVGRPYRISQVSENVEANAAQVYVNGEPLEIAQDLQQSIEGELIYIALVTSSGKAGYRFCNLTDTTFRDWKSYDGTGVDAFAYLLTGYLNGGDNSRKKQVNYVVAHFNKTENGYTEVDEDFVPNNPSSCLVQAQWDWSNSPNSNKWGREWQAYRFRRHYFPESASDEFENGYSTVVTKSKLRGSGKVLSLLFKTEPNKDCHFLGWSMLIGANGNV